MKIPPSSAFSKTYRVDFPKLSGGLNLRELDYRLRADESPQMQNLWWQNGVLQCRDGQVKIADAPTAGSGFACCERPFYGHVFFHIGSGLFCGDPAASDLILTEVMTGIPENRGTFFRYQDELYYKNKGGFYRISHDSGTFLCKSVLDGALVPVTVMNASPVNGSGDTYQPENRLTGKKTVLYNPDGTKVYQLPVSPVDSVDEVAVDGTVLSSGYTTDLTKGTVTFLTAPAATEQNNTVRITFTKENPDAKNAVMDCEYALVAGGDTNLCILLGGCDSQPNAVFWNANDALSMNPSYFPMTNYNLVGDTEDPITGFGRQYSTILVLKAHSVGKLTYTLQELDGRDSISFTYEDINTSVGCDLPWSIQLIENNLVFANTYRGVHRIGSSSAAFENNVECISGKIGGVDIGLMTALRFGRNIVSFDDEDRYWLCIDGSCWVWDYSISPPSDPSWFYFTAIPAVSFFRDEGFRLHHLGQDGSVTRFVRCFSDYGEGIEKRYRFPTQFFGGYDRLKDVTEVLLTVRSDTDTDVAIRYETDHETRDDHTPIRTYSWHLVPRELNRRCLTGSRYAFVARRKPGCRHIRHFSMTLENHAPGEDLAIVGAQIFYRYQGKER